MGLALEVGIVADLKEHHTEGFDYHAEVFKRLNSILAMMRSVRENQRMGASP